MELVIFVSKDDPGISQKQYITNAKVSYAR